MGSQTFLADVRKIGTGDLFRLSTGPEDEALRALALASRQLRLPLNQALNGAEALDAEAPDRPALDRLSRSLYQMLRVVLNMSDAWQNVPRTMELQDVSAVLQEVFDRSRALLQEVGIGLHFVNLPQGILSYCDSAMLERAVCNLLSNAAKQTPAGQPIEASLVQRGAKLYLTVRNSGSAECSAAGAFSRFLREPGLEDPGNGLGLGLHLVRSAASAHGGTVLLQPVPGGGMTVTMSLALRQKTDHLRAPMLRIDYAGERNHELIEFADLLPPDLYKP